VHARIAHQAQDHATPPHASLIHAVALIVPA